MLDIDFCQINFECCEGYQPLQVFQIAEFVHECLDIHGVDS